MNLSERILSMLNQQYRHEMGNAFRYDQRHGWADFEGFVGTAEFFKQEADGEREHAQKVLNYMLDRSAKPTIEPIAFDEPSNYPELHYLFESAMGVEVGTTAALTEIYKAALEEMDIMTVNFMAEMIGLQVEEERTLQTILDRYRNYPASPSREHDIDIWVKENFVA